MNRRRKESGGQAIVMVSLALLAMTGIMGFAVDFGWSFFVKKAAQTAADAGAMAAVQEAYKRMDGQFFSATCPNTTGNLYCTTSATSCVGMTETSGGNLYNGCLYAATSATGFCSVSSGTISCPSGVTLKIQAELGGPSGTAPPSPLCPTGVNCGTISKLNVPYWVQMSATQTIPQLFSSVLGNRNAYVAASAVAGINGTQVPGNLVLLDRPGDCYTPPGAGTNCGNNIDMTGLLLNSITAAGPIYMASTCNGAYTSMSCQIGSGTAGWAGKIGSFFSQVQGSVIETPKPTSGNTTTGSTWSCSGGASPCPSQVTQSSVFLDPTRGEAQPPLNVTLAAPSCGILNTGGATGTSAQITGSGNSASPLLLGPYNYYSYYKSGSTTIYDGKPISITGNVYFTQSGGCSRAVGTAGVLGMTGTSQSSNFDDYFFYGGMWINGFASTSVVKFDAGQYVMVGTNSTSSNFSLTSCTASGAVFCADDTFGTAASLQQSTSGSANGSTSGMMFIFTAPGSGYPGLSTQVNALTTAGITVSTAAPNYGSVNIQNVLSTTALTGILPGAAGSTVPASLNQYNGLLMWQDRGNSTVTYDSTGHVLNQTNTNQPPSGANGMNVFGLIGSTNVDGVIYQPEGAYLTSAGAGSGFNVSTQIVTGAIYLNGFIGVSVNLGTPTHLLSSYAPALMQ